MDTIIVNLYAIFLGLIINFLLTTIAGKAKMFYNFARQIQLYYKLCLEQDKGIEPLSSRWKRDILPLN